MLVLTACNPLQPQHVVRPDGLFALQRPQPGPRAWLWLRLGPGLGIHPRLPRRFHTPVRSSWSGLRPQPGPATALLHLHGLAGPRGSSPAATAAAACAGWSQGKGERPPPHPRPGPRCRPALTTPIVGASHMPRPPSGICSGKSQDLLNFSVLLDNVRYIEYLSSFSLGSSLKVFH